MEQLLYHLLAEKHFMGFGVLEKAVRNSSLVVFVPTDFHFSWTHSQGRSAGWYYKKLPDFFEWATSFHSPTSNVSKGSSSSASQPGLGANHSCSVLLTLEYFNRYTCFFKLFYFKIILGSGRNYQHIFHWGPPPISHNHDTLMKTGTWHYIITVTKEQASSDFTTP